MEAISAYIWKHFALAQALTGSQPTRIGIPIDGRACLNIHPSYFGNAIAMPFKESYAEQILEEPLSKIAEIVHNVIGESLNSEYFRSIVDWVEVKRPSVILARVYAKEVSAVVVSSGVRIPLYNFEFGCGKPAFSSVFFPLGGTAGYVMLQVSPLEDGNMVIYMHMAEKHLDAIEPDPEFVFVRANRMNFW
ncbi:hypothetical protein SUGI_0491680 [Cryptomeria japonica]|nr:hypothetical protein SUGI_0491680 [Cryptomeria japonica]